MPHTTEAEAISQGDDFSEKPRNVREFDSCEGNVRDFTKNWGNVREKICSRKSCLKLFIVSCIFASVQMLRLETSINDTFCKVFSKNATHN